MPNWCLNCVTFKHEDKAMMERLVNAVKEDGKGLFMEFFPTPDVLVETNAPVTGELAETNLKEFGATDWYNWNVKNWGTKWDATISDFDRITEDEAFVSFDTAWGPPIEFFEKMAGLGYTIDALYMESGMCFAGSWDNENGDECYEYDFSDDNWDKDIPENVKDFLQVEYENYQMWMEESALESNTVH